MLSYNDVRLLSKKGNVIPLHRRFPADLDTPVAAFHRLADKRPHSFLLESIEGGEKLARFSFIGVDPFLVIDGQQAEVTVHNVHGTRQIQAHPPEFLKELFKTYRPVKIPDLPRFTGGAVGFIAYDAVRWLERVPNSNIDTIGLPLMRLALYSQIVAFDHLRQEILLIANILHDADGPGLRRKYDQAVAQLDTLAERLARQKRPDDTAPGSTAGPVGLYKPAEYMTMVRKAKEHIREGDIFQAVLSQRWELSSRRDPLSVYRRLRRLNPSPYMFLLRLGDESVIGASPEMLARIESRRIETRPIAGTRPRGKNEQEDARLIRELLADEKELAEHTMLVDLGRNDIGRVAEPGSVSVDQQMVIEKYSHVIHIVSAVSGRLARRVQPLDGLLSCFPAGTLSGAPKIRAMEIIDNLEKYRRSVYGGCICYLDFWGNLDSCIAIRTVVHANSRYHVQAGAGIVADSQPKRELNETEAKAGALMEAVAGE